MILSFSFFSAKELGGGQGAFEGNTAWGEQEARAIECSSCMFQGLAIR